MPVPETTSAEAFERYVGGKCLRVGIYLFQSDGHVGLVDFGCVKRLRIEMTAAGEGNPGQAPGLVRLIGSRALGLGPRNEAQTVAWRPRSCDR